MEKVNRKLDGLQLLENGEKIDSPTIYINDIYDEYLRTGDLQESLQNAADALDRVFKEEPVSPLDMRKAKDNIILAKKAGHISRSCLHAPPGSCTVVIHYLRFCTVVEVEAPKGYLLDSTPKEVKFEYKDGKTRVVELLRPSLPLFGFHQSPLPQTQCPVQLHTQMALFLHAGYIFRQAAFQSCAALCRKSTSQSGCHLHRN